MHPDSMAFVLDAYFPQLGSTQGDHFSQAGQLLLEGGDLIEDIPELTKEVQLLISLGN